MSFAMVVRHMLLACIFVPSLQPNAQVTAGWPFVSSVSTVSSADIEPNVTLTGYVAKIQTTLQSLESMPVCRRLAHKTLLNSCGAYDGQDDHIFRSTDEAVKTFRDLFAIQMTACDLEDARQEMPASCQPVLRSISEDPRHDVSVCLSSLHESTNPWTTYTQNKNSGDVMCLGMRAQMDKTEQLEVLRKMFSALRHMGNVMEDHDVSLEQLLQMTSKFGSQLRDNFEAIQHESKELKANLRQSFGEVQKKVSLVGADVNSILTSLNQVDHGLQQHWTHVNNTFEGLMALGTSVDTWTTDVAVAREAFEELQAKMQLQMQQYLENVFKKVFDLTADVSRANEAVSSIAESILAINDGMEGTFATLQGVNTAAGNAQLKIGGISKTLDDIAVQTNSTQETMQLVNDHVEKMQSWVTIASALLEGFVSTTKCLKKFGLYYAMVTGLVMLCLTRLRTKLLNAILVSALLGYPVAHMVLVPLVSLTKATHSDAAVFQDECQARWQLVFYAGCGGILTGIAIKAAIDRLMQRTNSTMSDVEYDPASPGYLPTIEKSSI